MNRYFGVVAYKGTNYSGFQRQSSRPSVQGEIERVLSFLIGKEITIAGAGRTDAKVHASGQTFTFDCPKTLKNDFVYKANRLLPKDIEILSIVPCDISFHARHSSCGKRYRYRFLPDGKQVFEVDTLAQLRRNDFCYERFVSAIRLYLGTHNFQNFTTKAEDVDGFVRTIDKAQVSKDGEVVEVVFEGNGFMTYQVRIMVGVALKVALHQLELDDVSAALHSSTRKTLSFKAPPEGLFLDKVFYEATPGL